MRALQKAPATADVDFCISLHQQTQARKATDDRNPQLDVNLILSDLPCLESL